MNDRLYSMTIEEITEKFSTNAELGLSAKEADRRRRKGECGSIYKSVYSSPLTNMGRIAADITILIFALAAFVTAFFDSGNGTVVSLVITLLAYVFSMLAYAVSRRYSESLSEMSIPRARVIRGGKIMLVQPGDIVNGDLLIFEKGDVLPCDCRLVSSTELKAVEFIGRIGGKEKKALTTKDANFSCEKEDKINISEQKNMISASAVVISGKGKGIAVRTGRRTFISLMLGEIDAIPKSKNEPSVLAGISGILS